MKRQVAATVGGFTPVFDALVEDEEIGREGALVYGRIWRYCQMRDGVCSASMRTVAEGVGMSVSTVQRYAAVLVARGYLVDTTPDRVKAPHIFADSGKVGMKIVIDQENEAGESVAQKNRTVAQRDRYAKSVAQRHAKREGKNKERETRMRVITLSDADVPPNMRNQSKPPKKRKPFKPGQWKGYDPLPENRAPSVKLYRRIFPTIKLDRREVKVISNWKDVRILEAVLIDWRKVVMAKHWSPKNWQAIGERYDMKDSIIAEPAKNSKQEPEPVYN